MQRHVRSWGKTGSNRHTAKVTRLTQSGHLIFLAIPRCALHRSNFFIFVVLERNGALCDPLDREIRIEFQYLPGFDPRGMYLIPARVSPFVR